MPRDRSGQGDGGTEKDRLRVEHMRTAARDAIAIVGNDSAAAVGADMVRLRALVNCFTEIGEAAAKVSDQTRGRLPGVPWRQVVGMRNIIVHVYWGIDASQLVKTVHDDLPAFVSALDEALERWP